METRYRYNIFISSTFKDMDVERDVLKYNVIPLLNKRYRHFGIEFYPIDLRFGVNTENMTEAESEDAVLDVCLSKIENSRPFFIALIGDRYGWIPNEDRMQQVLSRLSEEKRKLVIDSKGCSVTELEILYGAIGGNGENVNHSLFFVRDPESYEEIPESSKSLYIDGFSDKMQSLKDHILSVLETKNRKNAFISYSLCWDSKSMSFTNTDRFANTAYQCLCDEIDAEIVHLSSPLKWYEYAITIIKSQIERTREYSSELFDVKSLVDNVLETKRVLVSGVQGMGKSMLLMHVYRYLQNMSNVLPLIAIIDTSLHLTQINNILFLWINLLEQKLSLPYTSDNILEGKGAYHLLQNRLNELVCNLYGIGIKVVCILDGVDSLSTIDSSSANLLWIPSNLYLLCSCSSMSHLYESVKSGVHYEYCLDCRKFSVTALVSSFESNYGLVLPAKLKKLLEDDSVRPMCVRLFMIMLSHLTAKDFNVIRNSSECSEIDKINNYILNLYQSLPKDIETMFKETVSFVVERLSADWLKEVVAYIVSSGTGLRKEDLALLVGNAWDELMFERFMSIFNEFFSEDKVTKLWNINNKTIATKFYTKQCVDKLCNIVSDYPNDDLLKKSYFVYYTIIAENAKIAEKFLCSDEVYNSVENRGYWCEDSVSLIENDRKKIGALSLVLEKLPSKLKVRLLYAYLSYIPWTLNSNSYLAFAEQIANLDSSVYSVDDSYALATLNNSAATQVKYFSGLGDLYFRLVDGAYLAYKKCYEIDPSYKDVRNMYRVAVMLKADILCADGDFNEAMKLYQSIN